MGGTEAREVSTFQKIKNRAIVVAGVVAVISGPADLIANSGIQDANKTAEATQTTTAMSLFEGAQPIIDHSSNTTSGVRPIFDLSLIVLGYALMLYSRRDKVKEIYTLFKNPSAND